MTVPTRADMTPTDTDTDPVPVGECVGEAVDEIVARAQADDAANCWFYGFGREVGYHDGYSNGYAEAYREIDAAWRELAQYVRDLSHVPTHDEIRRRREEIPE